MGRDLDKFIKDYVISDASEGWKYKNKARLLYELTDVLRFYFLFPSQPEDPAFPQPLLAPRH